MNQISEELGVLEAFRFWARRSRLRSCTSLLAGVSHYGVPDGAIAVHWANWVDDDANGDLLHQPFLLTVPRCTELLL